jgi:hypothetical protein
MKWRFEMWTMKRNSFENERLEKCEEKRSY